MQICMLYLLQQLQTCLKNVNYKIFSQFNLNLLQQYVVLFYGVSDIAYLFFAIFKQIFYFQK